MTIISFDFFLNQLAFFHAWLAEWTLKKLAELKWLSFSSVFLIMNFRISQKKFWIFYENHFLCYFFWVNWRPITCGWHFGRWENNNILLKTSCCISGLFFLYWFFVFPKKLLVFLWLFLWHFCFRISWRLTACCWLGGCSEIT